MGINMKMDSLRRVAGGYTAGVSNNPVREAGVDTEAATDDLTLSVNDMDSYESTMEDTEKPLPCENYNDMIHNMKGGIASTEAGGNAGHENGSRDNGSREHSGDAYSGQERGRD